MKTKDLIALLQKADPTGELECCVRNRDIFAVYPTEAYWDGPQQILVRDPANPHYNVVGAIFNREGTKVQIETHSIKDAIFENPELPVKIKAKVSDDHIAENIRKWREEAKRSKQ